MSTLDAVFTALSHPSRREIIACLSIKPARVTEIAAPFALSLNAVSKHLKMLERAGLVRRSRQGRDHFIELQGEPLREVANWLGLYQRFWNQHFDVLESLFREKRKKHD
jgi:DNA-binding transcriptional ArsR family regulator